jgi:hypothetical protein
MPHRQIGGLRAIKDLSGINAELAEGCLKARCIADKAASGTEVACPVDDDKGLSG